MLGEHFLFPPTLKMKCDSVLDEFATTEDHLSFLSLSTSDGYPLSNSSPAHIELNFRRISAMASSFAGISRELAKETHHPELEGSIIECQSGFLVCRLLKTEHMEAVLLGVFNNESNHGIALWTLNNIAKSITDMLNVYK